METYSLFDPLEESRNTSALNIIDKSIGEHIYWLGCEDGFNRVASEFEAISDSIRILIRQRQVIDIHERSTEELITHFGTLHDDEQRDINIREIVLGKEDKEDKKDKENIETNIGTIMEKIVQKTDELILEEAI